MLEVKGDFCYQIQKVLKAAGRPEDYIEVSLTGNYRYNPLHNDLDAFTLAYSIASLLNNLYGKGKVTVLAAGVHQSGEVHHSPAQSGR